MNVGELIGRIRRKALLPIPGAAKPCSPASRLRAGKLIAGAAACALLGSISLFAQGEQIFKGDLCLGPEGRTPVVVNGQSQLPCTIAHPKRGAKYILFNPDSKATYHLDGHNPKSFAGSTVVIVGVLDQPTGTIHIDEIYRAVPPKITQAKSVYIFCDACPRGMAAAWGAAFDALEEWGKYDITPDPKKADVVFIFSANPYAGDYITRDGPDKRGVSVDITYMNVVDAQTGKNLWEDSRQWGSLRVARATKDLIQELRLRMEEESQANPQALAEKHRGRKTSPSAND